MNRDKCWWSSTKCHTFFKGKSIVKIVFSNQVEKGLSLISKHDSAKHCYTNAGRFQGLFKRTQQRKQWLWIGRDGLLKKINLTVKWNNHVLSIYTSSNGEKTNNYISMSLNNTELVRWMLITFLTDYASSDNEYARELNREEMVPGMLIVV